MFATLMFAAIMVFGFIAPLQAGTLNYAEGRGSWQSSRCQPPQAPGGLSDNSEAAANDLNAQWAQHNQFVEAAQAYMNCLSSEAQGDAAAASQLVTQSAQSMIQQMQVAVSSSAANLRNRQPPVLITNP